MADLTALLSSPPLQLVTLTGPGGSGKTRLAVAAASRLAGQFPDGIYFVDLAAVTTAGVMWATIAEALDVPQEARTPPELLHHVAHRSVLLVLDNLEQIEGAGGVVDELLNRARQAVVLGTSRQPLNVSGERQHAVHPLGLPMGTRLEEAVRSSAVQLFMQTAQAAKAGFLLTPENAADVVAICRRLDGLPLAIELAAARSKLLSPHALLSRLDAALNLTSSEIGRPTRQHTLRDTMAWSYNLLNPQQQALFRRLGVFAGGAELDAIAAVCSDVLDDDGQLELVADLVDASLITISDDDVGEPGFGCWRPSAPTP